MARHLLRHEAQLLKEMLADPGLPQRLRSDALDLPKIVYRVHIDDAAVVNAGAMIIFREEEGTENSKVVSCCSFFPETIVGEVYLIADERNSRPAFMEIIGDPQMPRAPVQFLADAAWQFCLKHLCKLTEIQTSLDDLRRFSKNRSRPLIRAGSILERIRIAYVGTSVCFMFSQALSLLVDGGRSLHNLELAYGSIQVLSTLSGEIAIEGWCHLPRDEWERFCERAS